MKEQDIRAELHRILDSHDELLASVHGGHSALQSAFAAQQQAFAAHDAIIVSAIEANRAAIRLLNRIRDEGVEHDAK